jgi:hypothetical protein
MYLKYDPKFSTNQIQSFDRLYRTRSESQPPHENIQEIQTEQQQQEEELINNKQRPASAQLNPIRPTHQITSHTSLHAYWNDPNFDTQSQTSNCSSTTKKRQAPRPPGYISPTLNDQQILVSQSLEHHQSQESLTESINGTKQKRKAPVLPNTNEIVDDQQIKIDTEQRKIDINEQQTPPTTTQLVTTPHSPDQNIPESHSTTPIYSQIQKNKESTPPIESPYSTVKTTPTPPIIQQVEIISTSPTNYSVTEIVQAGIAEPPTVSPLKSSKKSTSTDGLIKIVNDHNERAQIYQANEKQAENVSYFRVAKSRHGKFETDNQGFINNSSNVFDSTNNNKEKSPTPIQV